MLQGFLIENDDQIELLLRYCRTVVIDHSRSIGDHHATEIRSKDRPSPSPDRQNELVQEKEPQDFFAVCRYLRENPAPRRRAHVPATSGPDGQSQIEAEILHSAPVVDDVKKTLESIRESIKSGDPADFRQAGCLVHEMALAVERNPDAMIWLARLKSTDQYAYDHAVDVSVHVMVFGKFLGLPAKVIEEMGLAGLMQDIGKVEMPLEILNKPGDLTPDEYAWVQTHVGASLEMLVGKTGFTVDVLNIIAGHHERYDGTGYPRRLKGEGISLKAEISGLADSYCAMTRQRPYGAAISSQKALESLIGMRDNKFRAPLVDQFIQCIGLYPVGSLVELNTGEVAVVIQQNQVRRLKPRVLVILAPDKSVERRPRTIDLMTDPLTPLGEPYRVSRAVPGDAYGIDPAEFYLA